MRPQVQPARGEDGKLPAKGLAAAPQPAARTLNLKVCRCRGQRFRTGGCQLDVTTLCVLCRRRPAPECDRPRLSLAAAV
jgi:hypothetical protein